jgi:hypothetical protein
VFRRLRELGVAYKRQFPDAPPILVRDISRRRAGRYGTHRSHCSGQDVDIQLPLKHTPAHQETTPATLDLPRAWFLVAGLLATCDVEFIFIDRELQRALWGYARGRHRLPDEVWQSIFQYPDRGRRGVIRHWPGHTSHLHVRFRRQRSRLHVPSAVRLCRASRLAAPGVPEQGSPLERLFEEHRLLLRDE